MNKKRSRLSVVVAVWKEEGVDAEAFSSLSAFLYHNPEYKRDTINHYIVRKKVPYETEKIILIRCKLNMNN